MPCRINVVGSDGHFYQPATNPLSPYSLTGQWPKTGKGNREGKAPIRYLGRFFYTTGTVEVAVPPGWVRIEVWKGFEYRPLVKTAEVAAGQTLPIDLMLPQVVTMNAYGYASGDPHLHFARKTEADDQVILSLLEAEDIHFGSILAYNEPAGPYTGAMETMDTPQLRGLGKASVAIRNDTWITSGQEYRGTTYGHLNLYGRDDLVLKGQKVNANNWPLYGLLARETRRNGGFAIHAHGGYAQSIYADFVQKNIDAVELLQFGVYRGIELADWYHILNIGYRFPCVGASDYPACRKLGDCQTYVDMYDNIVSPRLNGGQGGRNQPEPPGSQASRQATKADPRRSALSQRGDLAPPTANHGAANHDAFHAWFKAASQGRSFVTNGPLLLFDVDEERPGGIIRKSKTDSHRVMVRLRATCEVSSIQTVQLIVNGEVVQETKVPPGQGRGTWILVEKPLDLDRSSWIAARVFSNAPSGAPDAEAHTNPVYVYLANKAPYNRDSLDHLVGRIDQQIAIHRKRSFTEKARVLDYFQKSRDILLRIRHDGGLPADGVPDAWIEDASTTVDASRRTIADPVLQQFLDPLPALTPDQALKTFETVDGFRMELVAAEPMVQSPVAASFDADGNLYVAEMRDYPYKPRPGKTPLGTVRLLRDTNGDGRFDKSTVFADGLLWAAGIAPWKGGVFVTAPPDIWYLKDTNGDDRADVRTKVYTGFGTQNQQAMVNNLAWGLDHRIYGAAAGNGGTIRPAGKPEAPGVSVDHSDFRFDPVTGAFEPVSGNDQFGNTFDDWGNRFICDESHPLSQPVLPFRNLARNPFLAIPSTVQDIAGGSVPIFRISPIERWRQIRSSRRIAHSTRTPESAGVSHHVIDAGAGVTIYRGSAYPAEFYGNAFVGDAQNNLIHRRILITDGPTFKAIRGPREQATEFVRSSDNWFRPVNFVNAPDGTLYALDMSRAVIEAIHIPLDVVKHLDLKRGRSQGRIYRIAPQGFRHTPPPRLSQATTAELIAALDRPDAWYRDTAHRLIHERQDPSAIEPLRKLTSAATAPTRVNALWSLDGLKALRDEDLSIALADRAPEVRAQAVQLAASRLDRSPSLLEKILDLANDPDARVRFRVALVMGDTHDPRAGTALARIVQSDGANRWIRTAVLSASSTQADRLFVMLRPDWIASDPGVIQEFAKQLVEIVGARNRSDEVARVLDTLASQDAKWLGHDGRDLMIRTLARAVRRAGGVLSIDPKATSPGATLIARLVEETKRQVRDEHTPDPQRLGAIAMLSSINPEVARDELLNLLTPQQSISVQVAAVQAMGEGRSAELPALLLPRIRAFEPTVRAAAIHTLLSRDDWTKALLRAIPTGVASGLTPASIEPSDRAPLLKHRDPEIARLAQAIFDRMTPGSRAPVITDYSSVLQTRGDAARGVKVFERECKTCHKIGDRGFALGPDLTGSPSSDPAALLANILDPNANVLPAYVQYMVVDHNGRTFNGIIASETATSLTLRRGDGAEDIILRSQIAEISSTGLSLMPEGIEKTTPKPDMADLIAFLRTTHRGGDDQGPGSTDRPRPLDIGTLPGLIEPEE